jgi:prephenate dehydrogenase
METVGIIGGRGGFGKWLSELCSSHSVSVIASDIDSELSNIDVVHRSRVVFVCVPIGVTRAVLEEIEPDLSPDHLLVDLTSVKTPFLEVLSRLPSEVLSLHPMFAPTVGSGHGQSCVSCAIRSGHRSRHVAALFSARGVRMIPMEPGEHDRMMAVVQGLTHFQAISAAHCMMRLGFDVQESINVSSPVYRLRLAMIGRILGHDPRLYAEIQTYNPYIPDVLKALADSSSLLQDYVESKDVRNFVAECEKIKHAFGDFTTQSVAESERIIAALARSTS